MISALIAAAVVACISPHVADGDTITCSGVRVRIYGINAPELSHPNLHIAEEAGGREASARMLALTRGRRVTCAEAGNQYDRYGRLVAKCATDQTPDLGAEMIREGLACQWIRYSHHEYDGLARDCDRQGK